MSRSQIAYLESIKPLFTRPELLLEPQIIKPLHGLNPRTIKGQRWWDEQRQIAYKKNNYCCWACGTHKTIIKHVKQRLEAHESYNINITLKRYRLQEITALCPKCHNYIHYGRLTVLYKQGLITKEQYALINDWGDSILYRTGLNINDAWWITLSDHFFPEKMGTWNKWYLEIDGVKYYSKFKSYEEWQEFYSRSNRSELRKNTTTSSRDRRSRSGSHPD